MKRQSLIVFLALVLCVALTACGKPSSEPSQSAELSGETAEASDIDGHPSETAIREGLRRGLFGVLSDGLFHPEAAVTRGEFLAALRNLSDPSGASDALAWAAERGLVSSDASDLEEAVTRLEAIELLYAYNGGVSGPEAVLTGIYNDAFLDSAEIPADGKQAMYWGFYNVLIREPETDKLAPFDTLSRGDMAAMLVRYMDDFQSVPAG